LQKNASGFINNNDITVIITKLKYNKHEIIISSFISSFYQITLFVNSDNIHIDNNENNNAKFAWYRRSESLLALNIIW
jgi:hypothetical protein